MDKLQLTFSYEYMNDESMHYECAGCGQDHLISEPKSCNAFVSQVGCVFVPTFDVLHVFTIFPKHLEVQIED